MHGGEGLIADWGFEWVASFKSVIAFEGELLMFLRRLGFVFEEWYIRRKRLDPFRVTNYHGACYRWRRPLAADLPPAIGVSGLQPEEAAIAFRSRGFCFTSFRSTECAFLKN